MKETQHKVGRRILLTIVNEISVQPNAWNKDSSTTKGLWFLLLQDFWRYTTSITLLSKIHSINALPKASIYTLGNIAVSKVEEVETIEMVND